MTVEHFRFAPSILARLGEELVASSEQGLVELVLNAYDADATRCTISLSDTLQAGGSIEVSDNGKGMSRETIASGWLVFGSSDKTTAQTGRGRIPLGEKGIGRLAALRLGASVRLSSVSAANPQVEYVLDLDWKDFDAASTIEEVALRVTERPSKRRQGTTISIRHLRNAFGRNEVTRLARALLLVAQPFPDSATDFVPVLKAPDFPELERLTRESYFDDADYKLSATLDASGFARAEVTDWKGATLWQAQHKDLRTRRVDRERPYVTDPAKFELWTFTLDQASFSAKNSTLGEVRRWLGELGGVYLFRRGVRVAPYGDGDWLDLNLRRARSPEERPSTNNSIGRVVIEGLGDRLTPKTDRSGFVEDEAFADLRQFAVDAINWMSRRRLQASQQRREAVRAEVERDVSRAQGTLRELIGNIEEGDVRESATKALENMIDLHSREARRLQDDVQVYRTLATVGTTVSVFTHELAKKVSRVARLLARIRPSVEEQLPKKHSADAVNLIEMIDNAKTTADGARSYTALPLSLLNKSKRRVGEVHIHDVVHGALRDFDLALKESRVDVEFTLDATNDTVLGSVAAVEVVLANLITNAINAFNSAGSPRRQRRLLVETIDGEGGILLLVSDSGPGISLPLDDIWLPGQTTMPEGTGLGLAIVRDVVTDLGGHVSAQANGELGGARFEIRFPVIARL